MSIELTVPSVGESITEVQIGAWLVAEGAALKRDQAVVEIESEKATVEVFAPTAGTLTKILKQTGETATVGDVIGYMDEGKPASAKAKTKSDDGDKKPAPEPDGDGEGDFEQAAAIAVAPKSQPARAQDTGGETRVMPAAKRIIEQEGLQTAGVKGTGPGGRVLKEDAIRAAAVKTSEAESAAPVHGKSNGEEVVRMSPMRRTIAARLVEAQQTAALLTTFNEIDMTAVMAARKEHQDAFTKKHEIKLGFMSFFVKACVDALKRYPAVNAEIRGDDIVYHNYYDVGIAVGGGKGLVVPVIRNADRLSFAEIELTIADFGKRAQDNKIAIDELKGGTFTISNGGIYGSMLSTPIVNPPQSGILGLHAIKDRAVVIDGAVAVRPMMYVALTYDHRIVDGREAVTFLRRVVECVENPARMLLEI